MRTRNSIYNIIGVMILYFTKIIVAFIGKTILIRVMGDQYNGINGLFSNVISMLSIAELGIGSAIIYNLYEPVRDENITKIKSIMKFYQKCYHTIAGVVFAAGLCILPFIKSIVGEVTIKESVYILYIFFLLDSVVSYFLSYKRSIIYVYQKNYIISIFDTLYVVATQLLQVMVIIFTHNFLLYLSVMIISRVAENIGIHLYANKQYPFLLDKDIELVSDDVKQDIITKVKGLMFHNIGTYIVLGTDNILISKLVGIIEVGFYSNYAAILNPLASILKQAITAVQASVGDLLAEKDREKSFQVFKKLELINFWLYTAVSISIFYTVQDFVVLWLGERYLFNIRVVFCLVLNFWQTGMRNVFAVFKGAAGIYYEDRYVPLAESVINIISSIVLTLKFGIEGIFMGTFISSLCLFLYSYPVLVYKGVLGRRMADYFKSLLRFVLEWNVYILMIGAVSNAYDKLGLISNQFMSFAVKSGTVFVAVNFLLYIVHGRSDEFKYFCKLFHEKILKHNY